MRAVNLLPKDDGRQRGPSFRDNPLVIGAVVGTVLVTAVLAAMFLTASTSVADNQKQRDAVQAELSATPVPPPTVPGASELEQEKNARIGALSAALSGRLAWDRLLREVSLVLPDDVWLSSLSATAPVAASPTTTAGFAINGRTYSHDGVARLLARLSVVPHLSNVQLLHSSVATSDTGRKLVEFSINATVKGVGSA
jgi:Tfp pilus assembly protein PilN